MNKIIAALVKFLESLECHYEIDRAKGILHCCFESKYVTWRWLAQEDDEGRYVMVSEVDPVLRPEMIEIKLWRKSV